MSSTRLARTVLRLSNQLYPTEVGTARHCQCRSRQFAAIRPFASSSRARGAADSLVNIIAQDARSPVTISSLTPNAGFTMSDGLVLPSPIIMLDGAAFMWDVEPPAEEGFAWEGFNEDKLRIFEACVPRPEILLIGTGKRMLLAPPALKKYINSLGIQLDVQDSRNASSTYNLLAEEGRKIAAALYPVSHLSARTGVVA